MKERFSLLLLAVLALSACNEQKDDSANTGTDNSYNGRSYSVIGQLRPKADPNVIQKIHDEEEAARRAQQEQAMREAQQAQAQNQQEPLPGVNNSSFAGNLPSVTDTISGSTSQKAAELQAAAQAQLMQQQQNQSWAMPVQSAPPPPAAASYGINYTQPSAGFVPPPPAVSLSTSAVPMPPPGYNPYGMPPPGYNPYGMPQEQVAAVPAGRSAGGLFGTANTGARAAKNEDEDEKPKKKDKPIQIITPTGMEAHSPYKQRDELRILWKGALAASLSSINSDSKFADDIAKIVISLPPEASKGSLSVGQRQVDQIFKNTNSVDRKIVANLKKVQLDLVQAYYRYLYAYNKFFLTQQQVQARKQELDCAESQVEKQRATVDLAQAQQDAESSKEDMRASQTDLAAVAGANPARAVIKMVSGVSPSLDSLQVADASSAQAESGGEGGGIGGIFNVFGFGKKKDDKAANSDEQQQIASADKKDKEKKEKEKEKDKDKDKDKDRDKDKKDKKDKKGKADKDDKGDKEKTVAAKPAKQESSPKAPAKAVSEAAEPASSAQGSVTFELKNVRTTPRKSILSVVVKNGGGDNFSFDADSISVAEGNSKLAEAAVSAEFDSTIVQPSQEVSGTITIFGRPWNDKITVSLSSSGKKPIILHR